MTSASHARRAGAVRRWLGGLAVVVAVGGLAGAVAIAWPRQGPVEVPEAERAAPEAPGQVEAALDWLVCGGGPQPDANQASLEADAGKITELLGGHGRVLFAGGPGSQGVQVRDRSRAVDPLMVELGELFSPRGGRDGFYRRTRIAVDGAATKEEVLAAFAEAVQQEGGAPLFAWLGGHGVMGARADENAVALWGGENLAVFELAEVIERGARPVRLVVTTCHAGGFAELAFADADVELGATSQDRCGLFATTWDRQSGGCDADPDRREHDGYAVRFLQALAGRDAMGRALEGVDLDGDGVVNLLEAHTHARIASGSVDVPTTTSERWLRQVAPTSGPTVPVLLPEEERVIAALSAQLGWRGGEEQVTAEGEALEREVVALEAQEKASLEQEGLWYRRVAGELLARWPALDDPWHPDFRPTLEAHGEEIRAYLLTSVTYGSLRRAMAEVDQLGEARSAVQVRQAPWLRLAQALETRVLAGRLAAVGGADQARFEAFRRCERSRLPGR